MNTDPEHDPGGSDSVGGDPSYPGYDDPSFPGTPVIAGTVAVGFFILVSNTGTPGTFAPFIFFSVSVGAAIIAVVSALR